jgi:hypothetical protein
MARKRSYDRAALRNLANLLTYPISAETQGRNPCLATANAQPFAKPADDYSRLNASSSRFRDPGFEIKVPSFSAPSVREVGETIRRKRQSTRNWRRNNRRNSAAALPAIRPAGHQPVTQFTGRGRRLSPESFVELRGSKRGVLKVASHCKINSCIFHCFLFPGKKLLTTFGWYLYRQIVPASAPSQAPLRPDACRLATKAAIPFNLDVKELQIIIIRIVQLIVNA